MKKKEKLRRCSAVAESQFRRGIFFCIVFVRWQFFVGWKSWSKTSAEEAKEEDRLRKDQICRLDNLEEILRSRKHSVDSLQEVKVIQELKQQFD